MSFPLDEDASESTKSTLTTSVSIGPKSGSRVGCQPWATFFFALSLSPTWWAVVVIK